MAVLKKFFYDRPTSEVAKKLLGKFLCRKIGNKLYIGKIVETEAYLGKKDLACHSSKGRTRRNEVMFGPPGHAYIYFIYGMHYCFNAITEKEGSPCAVLIRALEPIKIFDRNIFNIASDANLLNGPAKLCREFKIDKKLNGHDLTAGKNLWIEDADEIPQTEIKKTTRIGVDYSGIWKDRLLRFYVKNNKFISKK